MALANVFLEREQALGRATQMQLQKLVYISHGWNLGLYDEPLAAEPVRAWDYGPVFPDLYEYTRLNGSGPLSRLIAASDSNPILFFTENNNFRQEIFRANLLPRELSVLDEVWKKYKNLTAFELSDLTHAPGTPWYQTYFNIGKNSIIDNKLISEHYKRLARLA